MKTLFIVAHNRVNAHAGEDYDDILEVDNLPQIGDMPKWASAIRQKLIALWDIDEGGGNRSVKVSIDAYAAFGAMVSNFKVLLKAEFGIEIDTSEFDFPDEARIPALDRESQELLAKLNKQGVK